MPCAAARKQNFEDCNSIFYMPPRLWLASRDRVVPEKWLSLLIYEYLTKYFHTEEQKWMFFR